MEIFNKLLVIPIINLLVMVYDSLLFLHVPYAFGFSIIILTVIIRLALAPLTGAQLKSSKKMQELNPHIQKLKEKHKGDSKMIQSETMKLYKEYGVNPMAGCLPLVIQLPFIWAFYSVLNQVVHLGPNAVVAKINSVLYFPAMKLTQPWDPYFFGLPLGVSPSHLWKEMPLVILIPVITGLLQFIQSKMLIPQVAPGIVKADKKNQDFASSFQSQSSFIFPILIGVMSFGFPIGLSLYWNTFTIFGIIQQYKIQGWGSFSPVIKKIWKK